MSEKDFEHEYTHEIVCPNCGDEHLDSWECEDEDPEMYCYECHCIFSMTRNTTVTYSTKFVEMFDDN